MKEKEKITLSTVKSMGFTDKLVKELLPAPELKANPHYTSGPKMKLWDLDTVKAAMDTEQFQKTSAAREKRKAAAQKAVATKTQKLQKQMEKFLATVKI